MGLCRHDILVGDASETQVGLSSYLSLQRRLETVWGEEGVSQARKLRVTWVTLCPRWQLVQQDPPRSESEASGPVLCLLSWGPRRVWRGPHVLTFHPALRLPGGWEP